MELVNTVVYAVLVHAGNSQHSQQQYYYLYKWFRADRRRRKLGGAMGDRQMPVRWRPVRGQRIGACGPRRAGVVVGILLVATAEYDIYSSDWMGRMVKVSACPQRDPQGGVDGTGATHYRPRACKFPWFYNRELLVAGLLDGGNCTLGFLPLLLLGESGLLVFLFLGQGAAPSFIAWVRLQLSGNLLHPFPQLWAPLPSHY